MDVCPKCGASGSMVRNGVARGKRRWKCRVCGRTSTENPDPKNGGGRRKAIYADAAARNRAYRARLKAKKRIALRGLDAAPDE